MEEKNNEVKDIFYDHLDQLFECFSSHEVKVVLRDIKVQALSEEILRPIIGEENLHEVSNDRTELSILQPRKTW